MSKSENIHFTKKWKKRRKDHDGDKCSNAKFIICSSHKRYGNTSKFDGKKQMIAKDKSYKNEY